MRQPVRARFAFVIVALSAVLLGVVFLWLHLSSPFDGARLVPGQPAWRPDGVIVTPVQEQPGGLHQGDVVVAIEGKSMESWARALFEPGTLRPQWHVGQTIIYTVVRSGHQLKVPVTLGPYPLGIILISAWSTILFALVFFLVAAFVFLLRPDDRAARVQLLMGASIVGATTWSLGLHVGDLVSGIGFWLFKATTLGMYSLFWISILQFALVFPQSHPLIVKRSWIIPLIYLVPSAFELVYIAGVWPGATSTLDWLGRWILGESILPPVCLVAAIFVLIWNYRASRNAVSRQKIRWIMFATLVSGGGSIFVWHLPNILLGHPIISTNALGLLALPYPLALAIAIVRHRLFDIDLLINRTLVYGTVTTTLSFIYVGLVFALQSLTHALTGEAGDNPLVVVCSTLVIAALFNPLRRRMQAIIDRRFYRRKYDAAKTLAAFSSTLRQEVDLDQLREHLVTVVQETMQPAYVSLWLRPPEPARKRKTWLLARSDEQERGEP